MSCINFKDPFHKAEFERLLGFSIPPLQIEKVFDYMNGDTSSIKTREDFIKVLKKSIDESRKKSANVAKLKTTVSNRALAKFTPDQIDELVDNILFLASWDGDSQSILEIENINLSKTRDHLLTLREKDINERDGLYKKNFDEVLKPENLERLLELATAKLNSLNIMQDLESDPDDKNEGFDFADSTTINNEKKAKAYVKLLVASLPSANVGTTLGIVKFVEYHSTFAHLENTLSDVVIKNGEDAYEVFMKKISDEIPYKPEYIHLKKYLDNAESHNRTKFIRAFSTVTINHQTTVISEDKDGRFDTKYINSDSFNQTKQKVDNWGNTFVRKYISIDNKKNAIVDSKSKAKISKLLKRYSDVKNEITARLKDNETTYTPEDLNTALAVFEAIGVKLDKRSLIIYLNSLEGNELEALDELYSKVLDKVYVGTKTSTNDLPSLLTKEITRDDEGYIKSPISDERYLKELADIDNKFSQELASKSFTGADGKSYQTNSQYSFLSKSIESIQNNDEYLDLVSSPYNTHSLFLKQLRDPENKKRLKLSEFNSRRMEGRDAGKTIKNISPIDEYADRIDRVVTKDQLFYVTLADKNKVPIIEGLEVPIGEGTGVTEVMIDTVMGYFADELITMRKAIVDIENSPTKRLLLGYHLAGESHGSVFTSSILPSLNPGTEDAKKLGLYNDSGIPYTIAPTYIEDVVNENEELESINVTPGFFTNEELRTYVKGKLESLIDKSTNKIMNELFTFDDKGIMTDSALSKQLLEKYIDPRVSVGTEYTTHIVRQGVKEIARKFAYNSFVANVEWAKLFTGDPRKYKNEVDYMKRVPATTATGDYLYVSEKNGVNETFDIVIGMDIVEPSTVFTNTAMRENIAKWIGVDKNDEDLNNALDAYKKVDRTDAQGWMTMSRFKEILKGLGEWNDSVMNPAFERILAGTETTEDMKLFMKKSTSMQPRKGVHFELVKDSTGEVNPFYLKYSTAVLFPGLIKSSPQLSKLAAQMEAKGVSEAIVASGVKGSKIAPTDLGAEVIDFNTVTLSNRYWKLQQDLPFKDKETNVGSQIQKNILADISLDADYGNGRTGEDVISDTHSVVSELSERGFQKVLKKLGLDPNTISYDEETGEWDIDPNSSIDGLYDLLIKEFIEDGETGDVIDALKGREPLEFILTHRGVIMSKIASIFTKAAIKLKQPGGAAIQMSNYGYEEGDNRYTNIQDLPKHIKNEILWLKPTNELLPPSVKINKDGKEEFQRGQVALPYSALEKIFGEEWYNIKNLPLSEIKDMIDDKALEIIGYRIPNQKLASNDTLEIVAILPPTVGNTIIAYKEITTKTGSDFDIDKMYYIMRPVRSIKKNGKVVGVEAIKYLDGSNSTLKDRARALLNSTDDLARILGELYEHEDSVKVLEAVDNWYKVRETAYYKKGITLSENEELYIKLISEIRTLKEKKKTQSSKDNKNLELDIADLQFSLLKITREEDRVLDSVRGNIEMLVDRLAEDIATLPMPEQNTERALQSKRVDLYDEILSHRTSYIRLISTVDPVWLPAHIKMMNPNPKNDDLEFYSAEYNIATRAQNGSSKGGVGQTANQLTDHAISQWAKKYIKQFDDRLGMGNMTEDGHMDLSKHYAESFEVIEAYDEKGNKIKDKDLGNIKVAKYKLVENKKNKYYITEIISAYMNAFVDAAKDNYIGTANFNSKTNNTAFLLLRSGVSPQFVNALLSQPIIKRFIEISNIQEGQVAPKNTEKALDLVLKEFNISNINTNSKLGDYSTLGLMNNILDYSNGKEISDQGELLELFLHFREISKSLRDSVMATKSDTGIGKSLLEAFITTNKKINVERAGIVGNFDRMFKANENNTMAGAFYKNGPQAAMSIVGSKTILGTRGMKVFLQTLYRDIWGKMPDDVGKVNKLYQMAMAAIIHKSTNITASNDELRTLFSGDRSIANRTEILQQESDYENNMLLMAVITKKSYSGDISYVGINNAKPRNATINRRITEAWLELYEDPITKQYAIDLAKYSFYSSAFKDNLSSLYRLIPLRVRKDIGITTDTFNRVRAAFDDVNYNTLKGKVMRNYWKDTEIVPRIGMRQAKSVLEQKGQTHVVFKINSKDSPNLVVGKDESGIPIYKPYVLKTSPDEYGKTLENLFEYVGNIYDDETNTYEGVYKKINKSGKSYGVFKLYEFNFDNDNKSILPENNISDAAITLRDDILSKLDFKDFGEMYLATEKIIVPNLDLSEKISSFEESDSKLASYSEYVELSSDNPMSESDWNSMSEDERERTIECIGKNKK